MESLASAGTTAPSETAEWTEGPRLLPSGHAYLAGGSGDRRLVAHLNWSTGIGGGHHHRDKLQLDLFAQGRQLSPDLGYPQNLYHPATDEWVRHTWSHNTVTVDGAAQAPVAIGEVRAFAQFPGFSTVRAGYGRRLGLWPGVDVYERSCAMIDLPDGGCYLVDQFWVHGGTQHDYGFHGASDVALVEGLGDASDADLGCPWFQDVVCRDVPAGATQTVSVTWPSRTADGPGLALHLATGRFQRLYEATGYRYPPTQRDPMRWLVAESADLDARSSFLGVFEPLTGGPRLKKVAALPTTAPDAGALRIASGDVTDTVLAAGPDGVVATQDGAFALDRGLAWLRCRAPDNALQAAALVGGTHLESAPITLRLGPCRSTTIRAVDHAHSSVAVDPAWTEGLALPGSLVLVDNGHRVLPYQVKSVEQAGAEAWLRLSDLPDAFLEHCGAIVGLEGGPLTVDSGREAVEKGDNLVGGVVTDEGGRVCLKVAEAATDHLSLAEGLSFPPGFGMDADADGLREFRVYDLAPGDELRLVPAAWLSAQAEPTDWRVCTNVPAELTWRQSAAGVEALDDEGHVLPVVSSAEAGGFRLALDPSAWGGSLRLRFPRRPDAESSGD